MSPDRNSFIYGQLVFNKGTKNTQWGKDSYLQKIVLGNPDIHMKKN